jgi:ACS family glucarate transporter-like MFS transporter
MKRKKWWIALYMSCGIAISYLVRVNISHAIIPIAKEYSLNEMQQGMLLSAFAWGYVALMFIGGIMVDKFGALKMSFRSAIAWSLCTAVSSIGFSWTMIFSSELLAGASEAPIFPSNAKIVKNNFGEDERGRATAIFDSGSYIGTAISAPLMSFLIVNFSWRYAYIVIAIVGILWAIVWKYISKNLYDTNEFITKTKLSRKNVIACITNKKVIGMSLGFFCYNYIKNFYLTWFPSYLVAEKGFSILKVGIWGMLPSIAAVIGGLIAGTITDKMISKGYSKTFARKLPLCVGLVCSSSIVFANYVQSGYFAVALLSFAFAMAIAASPSIWSIPGDIAPDSNLVGTIGGIQNTVSNIAGIVAPIVTGAIIYKTDGFEMALLVSGIVACIGAFSYIFIVGRLDKIVIK